MLQAFSTDSVHRKTIHTKLSVSRQSFLKIFPFKFYGVFSLNRTDTQEATIRFPNTIAMFD